MTAELDPLTLPSTCAVAWADRDSIFIRYPGPNGIPCIVRYPKTYTALTHVFGILAENPMETRKLVPRHPATKTTKPIDARMRNAALEALRKRGIL